MVNVPYGNVGIAGVEQSDIFTQHELFSGPTPLVKTEDFPVGQSIDWPAFTVVGIGSDGNLAMATYLGSVAGPGSDVASGALTFSGNAVADETVTIGGRVYTWKAALTAADQVLVGASAAASAANLAAAINADPAGDGVTFGEDTEEHADVHAEVAGSVVTVYAKTPGAAGNAIATTETMTNAAWGAATLAAGEGAGVQGIGITTAPVVTGAGESTRVAIFRAGNFNPAALNWHASFDTDGKKEGAFRGAPTPTDILIRKRL